MLYQFQDYREVIQLYIYILFQILFIISYYWLLVKNLLVIFFQAAVLFVMKFSQVPPVGSIVFIENKYLVGVETVKVKGKDCWWPRWWGYIFAQEKLKSIENLKQILKKEKRSLLQWQWTYCFHNAVPQGSSISR